MPNSSGIATNGTHEQCHYASLASSFPRDTEDGVCVAYGGGATVMPAVGVGSCVVDVDGSRVVDGQNFPVLSGGDGGGLEVNSR